MATTQSVRPRGRAGHLERPRETLLQAALEVFSRKGFAGATVREIAAHANVNHGAIRYHYQTKDNLWRAAVTFLFERQTREMDVSGILDKDLSDREILAHFFREYVRYCARHPEHARIAVQESITGGDRLKWMAEKHIRVVHGTVGPYFESCMEKGLLAKVNVVSFMYMHAMASQAPFLLAGEIRAVHGVDVTSEEFIEQHAQTMVDLYLS
jgi:AcrR family transcriptional regulator